MYKEELDLNILENIKEKVQKFLIKKNLENHKKYRERMDNVTNLFVVDSHGKFKMKFSAGNENEPDEISIDKSFAIIDEDNKPIGINKKIRKLIESQLGHEVIHSAANWGGQSGIHKNEKTVGLNEGITQMITEKIFGYVLSPNTDAYTDLKKIAKILDITFGEDVMFDTYFEHTDNLEVECSEFTGDRYFYKDLNRMMSEMYAMRVRAPFEEVDSYLNSILIPMYNEINTLTMEKVCANIIVPKLKSLSREEKTKYIADILTQIKDDQDYSRKLSSMITKFIDFSQEDIEELNEEIKLELFMITNKAFYVKEVYNSTKNQGLGDLVTIKDNGDIYFENEEGLVEDELFKEKILSKDYLFEHNISEEELESIREKIKAFCKKACENGNTISINLPETTEIEKMKQISLLKLFAKNSNYLILNSLSDLKDNNLNLEIIHIPQDGKVIDFDLLKSIYEKYEVDYDEGYPEDFTSDAFVKERKTGRRIEDLYLIHLTNFANLWVKAAGLGQIEGEEIPGITSAFYEENKDIYNFLCNTINENLEEYGEINTEQIFKELEKSPNKNAKIIAYTLFKNQNNLEIVHHFFGMQNNKIKLEIEVPKRSIEIVDNIKENDEIRAGTRYIMDAISSEEIEDKCVNAGVTVLEATEAFYRLEAEMEGQNANKVNTNDKDEVDNREGHGEGGNK